MLARRVAAAMGLWALACGGAARAEEPAGSPSRVPEDRLPVLGTVGDYPPEAERVVVDLHAGFPPSIFVDGRRIDLPSLKEILRLRSGRVRGAAPSNASPLHLVVRADRAVRWQDAQWVLQAACDPAVRVHRVLFAAMPEDGGEEGAMALYLPMDAGATGSGATAGDPPRVSLDLSSGSAGPSDPARAIARRLGSLAAGGGRDAPLVTIRADPEVATGAVLVAADALLRSGAKGVLLQGTSATPHPPAAPSRRPSERPGIRMLGEELPDPGADAVPPLRLARVRGALAGQTSIHAPAVIGVSSPVEDEDGAPRPGAFSGRRGGHRNLKGGPTQETEEAVLRGLEWLRAHQSPEGCWDSDGFDARCRDLGCGGGGGALYDVGVTGLATLAFLGYGETHKTPRYGHVVRNALKFLKNAQDAEGCFGSRTSAHFTYNHAIATLAMVEAYGLTQSPLFKSSAQNGVNFIEQCRNPGLGWRYGVRPQDNDTSITGWMVLALKSARSAGLEVPDEAFRGAVAWLDRVTDPETGRAGYTARGNGPCRPVEKMDAFPSNASESLTAIAVLSRIFCGAPAGDPMVRKGADVCLAVLPRHDENAGTVDFTYWHFGTLAMFQVGGDAWAAWQEPMKSALAGSQRKEEGHARGSWDPKDPWAGEGGRVYSTALAVLCLETYYRYARVVGERR